MHRRLLSRRRSAAPDARRTDADRRREFQAVFAGTAAGRRVFDEILVRCRVLAPSHVAGDTHETARREGMRDVGLWLLDRVGEAPEAVAETAEDEPAPPGPPQ